jgi:hypothetical protein
MTVQFQSHKNKKPTKKQLEQSVIDKFQSEVKSQHIKNIMIGFETANQLILDKINEGSDIKEIKSFCEKNIKNNDIINKIME